MSAGSPQDKGAEFFATPEQANHRRYEALRAFYADVSAIMKFPRLEGLAFR